MEQQSAARGRPDQYDHGPYSQQAGETAGWNPIAATPDLDHMVSANSPPERSRVSFAPVSPPPGAVTPSSAGLGIDPADYAGQYTGYYPVVTRDSFQQDSPPKTPPQGNDTSKSTISPQEYALASPYGAPYYYPHPYDGSPPPSGPGDGRFSRLTDSNGWKMVTGGWPMYALFLFGFGCAVGHHAFYTHLDGKPADDQIRMMRFGGLLSYAAKASLVAAVIFAYRQQIWVTVINNVLRLRTIDSLFAAVNEPLSLWNWEFLKKARVAACLAVLAWLFPLTVILTPATLTVAPLTEIKEDMCRGIRTLNFEREAEKNWRAPEKINGFRSLSFSLYNSTVNNSAELKDPYNTTFFDYYTGSSAPVDLVAAQSALTGTVIPRRDATLETCGGGWNCSYTISFRAPGYKCSEFARGRDLDAEEIKRQGAPFTFNVRLLIPHPNANHSYLAETNGGNYWNHQLEVASGGAPKMKPPYPKNLGAFRTEPVLWVGYSRLTRPGPPPPFNDSAWDKAFETVVLRCEHYVTDYTVRFNHTFSEQTTTVLKRDYLRPIIDTKFLPGEIAEDGTFDNITATPESNYVFPQPDFRTYRITAAYHSFGSRLRQYLNGHIQYHPFAMVESQATKTRIIDTETYLPVDDLMPAIQQLYENMTLSILSNPQFLVVTWAARPDNRSGVTNTTDGWFLNTTYPCTRTRVVNAYVFNRRDLWIAYAAAIGAALFAVVLGTAALSQNNFHVRDTHVSSVVAATRAPCLENLPWKASKWGEVPEEILETKLGYGVVAENGPNGTPAAIGSVSGMWMGGVGSPRVVLSGKVYYGFAPREVLERTRVATFGPGRAKSRMSAFSFKTWEQHG